MNNDQQTSTLDIEWGRYKISPDGTIYDLKLKKNVTHQVLNKGHIAVNLRNPSNIRRTYLLNKVMFFYFNGEIIDRKHVIHHKDKDLSNCAIDNLEVITRTQLLLDSHKEYPMGYCEKCGTHAPLSPKMKYHKRICDGSKRQFVKKYQ